MFSGTSIEWRGNIAENSNGGKRSTYSSVFGRIEMRTIKEIINGIEHLPHDSLLTVTDLDKERGMRVLVDRGWTPVSRSEKVRK